MNNTTVLTVGGSRNIGYISSIRLLDLGATVTFLLRKPSVFDNDETIQNYVRSGKARLVQGDALVKEDVRRAWTAARGEDNKPVDFLISTVGGTPKFELSKGFVISPPNIVASCMVNCLETLPTPHPKIIVVSSVGVTRASYKKVPLPLKPVYSYALNVPLTDKRGAEEVLSYCAGWDWKEEDRPGPGILNENWKESADLPAPGSLKSVVVVRPGMLTDGACRGDTWQPSSSGGGGGPYKVVEGDLTGRWTISRKDVAHFVVEKVVRHWDEWEGKRVSMAY